MTITAAEVFRDYATADVPVSGAHKPSKSEIRALLARLEASADLVDAAISSDITNATYRGDLARRQLLFTSAI